MTPVIVAMLAATLAVIHPARCPRGSAASLAAKEVTPENYTRWLARDVAYLITPDERRAFEQLRSDAERARFVDEFWQRRDPTPATEVNQFCEEWYRRLDEVDRKFGAGVAGWRSDRGRIYLTWGPPDFVETNPAGSRGLALGAWSEAQELATEIWTYDHLPPRLFGVTRAQILFVDRGAGDYRLLTDPHDANLAYVYRLNTPANPLQYESAVFFDPATGLPRTDRTLETARSMTIGPDLSLSSSANVFDRIAVSSGLARTPDELLVDINRSQRARRLEAEVRSRLYTRPLPVRLLIPVFRVPGTQAYCPLAASVPGDAIVFEKYDRYEATLDVQGEVLTPSGGIVRRFSEMIAFHLTPETLARVRANGFTYHKPIRLPPGVYTVQLAIKDEAAAAIGIATETLVVPADDTGFQISGLLLATRIVGWPAERAAPFTLGSWQVTPSVDRRFRRTESPQAVFQVDGLAGSAEGPVVTIDYTILREDHVVWRTDIQRVDAVVSAVDLLVAQPIPLDQLMPGEYILQVKAIDHRAGRYATARIGFSVVP